MNCNNPYLYAVAFSAGVSIPNRDFGELQFSPQSGEENEGVVSIPNRDFGELQFLNYQPCDVDGKFQSLIGILVNCNPHPSRGAN